MVDLPARPLPGAVFSVAEARALGLPPSMLRRKEFDPAGYGLRAVRGRECSLAELVRPLARATGRTAASHVTAAALWECGFRTASNRPRCT